MTDPVRCTWCGTDPLYIAYHDTEWGRPERRSQALFEMLLLEGFQSGLSWITILRKRDGFRRAFAGFDAAVMAGWGEMDVARLVADPGIIRHRGKIEAALKSARAYLTLEASQGFAAFVWATVDGTPLQNNIQQPGDIPAQTALSVALSKGLKKNGFGYCGPTTTYAFMQAAGLVNDHVVTCHCHAAHPA